MPVCANCGSWQPDEAAFCDECGHPLRGQVPVAASAPDAGPGRTVVATPPPAPLCPVCGATTVAGDPFCTNCGAALAARSGDATAPPAAQPGCGATVVAMQGGRARPRPNSLEVPQALSPSETLPPSEALSPSQAPSPRTVVEPAFGQGAAATPTSPDVGAASQGPPVCASCGAELQPDSRFCDMCGAPVVRTAPPEPWDHVPPRADAAHWPPADAPDPQARTVAPPAQFPAWHTVAAEDRAVAAPLPVYEPAAPAPPTPVRVRGKFVVSATNASLPFPPGRDEIIVGRQDPVNGIYPEIDLTDHGGDEGGVSRKHARITQQGSQFAIEDLNSTNHTYVNRSRLTLGERRVLYEGDEVAFGRVKVIFQVT